MKDGRGMRWHPVMIKWALNLKMLSSAAYHAARTSGFMSLPSERLLREYIHYYHSKAGFHSTVNDHLMREAKIDKLTKIEKHVVILLDEMKVREDIVFNKTSGEVVKLVYLGDFNSGLHSLEQNVAKDVEIPVATHVLGLMVRGLVTSLKFPYAHFPTTGKLTGLNR